MVEQSRRSPFVIQANDGSEVVVTFAAEVSAIAFFHNCLEIQSICESGKYKDLKIDNINFNLFVTEWFDTLALCYLLLFAWNAKHRLKIDIKFSLPQKTRFISFLVDNGFYYQMRNLENLNDTSEEIPIAEYSTIHKCFMPLQILTDDEQIPDLIENVSSLVESTFCDIIESSELDYTINKLAYFLQETLDNVYSHAYQEKNKPCSILIKHVYSKEGLDVEKYEKRYISKTPYISTSLFENYEEYFEVYVADIGMGIRESFLNDPTGADSQISDENILEYILTDGQRSHKRMSRVPDTAFGGLYDIYNQFKEDGDSLGIKADGSWFFNGKRVDRISTDVLYGTYKQLMHGFSLVAAIHINPVITDRYEFVNQLRATVNSYKNVIFSDGNSSILRDSLSNTIVNDYRPKLDKVVSNRIDITKTSITVRYPDVYWQKARITDKILTCKTHTLIVAGIQESEIKKYRSLVESFTAERSSAKKIILLTNTLYVFVYNLSKNKFSFSNSDTENYIKCSDKNIGCSFVSFLLWDRAYNSACIWSLAKSMDSLVYINDKIDWNDGSKLQGYLDFSQLCRIPICRDFCINRLMVLHFFEPNIYFKSVDRLTEEICEQANYLMGNSAEKRSIKIGSVFVSGSSSRMSTSNEEQFYFFKHSNSKADRIYSIFEWATRIEWINKSFLSTDKDKNQYARIGHSPFVANEGANYWAKRHYNNHKNEYRLSQGEVYQVLQRQIGIHPATMQLGHFDFSNHHDLFGFRTTALFESDLILNQIVPAYNDKSCSDFLITEFIYALCGKCSKKFLTEEVLSPDLSAGKRNAIVKKYIAAKKGKKKNTLGVVVYLYEFQTSNIMEKIASLFSEKYQKRIIPIMSVDRDYSETSLLVPPLMLDRLEGVVKTTRTENKTLNNNLDVNATVFMASSFTVRAKEELRHFLLSIGVSKVFLLTILDRQRILIKSDEASTLISFGRIDLPALGSVASCPICDALELLRDVTNELITPGLLDRLNSIQSRWEVTKESDNSYKKGISLHSILLSDRTKKDIERICELYNQGQFNIQTNIALAMFAIENAIITSSPDFLSNCIANDELIVDANGVLNEDMSDKMKILLLCTYLLSAGTMRTSERQVAEYAKMLSGLVSKQKEVSEYSGLAVITICVLPNVIQKYLQQCFVKEGWNDSNRYLNNDALLIHLIMYHLLCHRQNSSVDNDYANLLRCYFKAGKSQLDFIYEAFLYSEKDYKQSHVQALAQIAASSQLEKYTYMKGSRYVAKIIELVTSKYYETLFHDPSSFIAQRDQTKQQLFSVKEKLEQITELSSKDDRIEAKRMVSDLLERLHNMNTQGIYLRVPSSENERAQIEEWLIYCRQKAYERVPEKYRYKDITLSIDMGSSFANAQSIRIRPWFYSFSDVTEEIINVYVDMLKGASRRLLDNGITHTDARMTKCVGIIKVRFSDSYVELTFYNATDNNKTIEEIQKIKDSKRSRSSLLAFREFERKFGYTHDGKETIQCFQWEYVENRFPGCVEDGTHIFSATIRIPYIDMGSSSAFDD